MKNEQIRPLARMLHEIAELCEHSSLTGSLAGGEAQTARRYNSCVRQLLALSAIPAEMFDEISESHASYTAIGVDARLVRAYLRGSDLDEDREGRRNRNQKDNILIRLAPFVRGEDLALLVKKQMQEGMSIDEDILTSLAPFMPGELLTELIHASMLRQSSAAEEPKFEGKAEDVAEPAPAHAPNPEPVVTSYLPVDAESREDLIQRLSQPHLSDHEIHTLAVKIASMQ